jgi:hypothetical protein
MKHFSLHFNGLFMSKSRNDAVPGPAEPQRKTAETVGDTAFAVIDKLAGQGNNLKLDFDRFTVGFGGLEATVDGALRIDVLQLAK